VEIVASLSQGRTAAAQCSLFTHKLVPVIFEPPCIFCANCISTRYLKIAGPKTASNIIFGSRILQAECLTVYSIYFYCSGRILNLLVIQG